MSRSSHPSSAAAGSSRRRSRLACAGAAPLAVAAVSSALWAPAGCTAEPVTELVAGVSTQVRVPRDLKAVRVLVQRSGEVVFCQVYDVSNGVVRLPQTLGVLSTVDPASSVAITVTGFMKTPDDAQVSAFQDCTLPVMVGDSNSAARILRKSVQPYADGRILYIPMPLSYACFDADCTEGGAVDKTCVAGKCVSPDADPERFLDYDDAFVDGDANTCFSLKRCLADAVPVVTVDADNCIYALAGSPSAPPPQGEIPPLPFETHGDGLNIRVWYEGGLVSEVLDLDENEGYTIPDPSKPQQIKLADGLCHPDAVVPHKIVAISGSGLCPSKTITQPICTGEEVSDPDEVVDVPGGGEFCEQLSLAPTPSRLLLLMDKSKKMSDYFGETAFGYVMGISLNDPVFEHTQIAMGLLPFQEDVCGDGEEPPDLEVSFDGFEGQDDPAGKARAAISALLRDTTANATDEPLQLDGVLGVKGAQIKLDSVYKHLGDATDYNRAAVALIGNRDFSASCVPGLDSPEDAAEVAAAVGNGFYTYTVVLPGGPLTEADAIARAGGTDAALDATAYDSDPQAAADAINTLITDLSSCFYDPSDDEFEKLGDAVISYFDPVLQKAHKVPKGDCSSQQPGWSLDETSQRLEICGEPCDELRDVLKTRLLLAQARGETPVDVPIVASTVCPLPGAE